MKIQSLLNKKIQGNSLAEIIVVIAIMSMTMLSVVTVLARSMKQVKRNEIEDTTMATQLRAIEYIKSPNLSEALGNLQEGDTKNFHLVINQDGISLEETVASADLTLTNCNTDSEYYIDNDDNNIFCNQIKVEAMQGQNGLFYKVTSKIVYWIIDHFEESEIISFRPKKVISSSEYTIPDTPVSAECGNGILEQGEECELGSLCNYEGTNNYGNFWIRFPCCQCSCDYYNFVQNCRQ